MNVGHSDQFEDAPNDSTQHPGWVGTAVAHAAAAGPVDNLGKRKKTYMFIRRGGAGGGGSPSHRHAETSLACRCKTLMYITRAAAAAASNSMLCL